MRIPDMLTRPLLTVVAVAAFAGLSAQPSRAQGSAPLSQTGPAEPDDNTPREIIYPYYSLREGYDSTLYLMDRSPRNIEYMVAVHSLSGRTVWAKARTIGPRDDVEIDMKEFLSDLGVDYRGDFLEGSLSIHFKGQGNPLGGRMIIEGPHETLNLGPVWSMGEFGQNMVPTVLNALWYDLGGSRDVEATVTNITGQPVVADFHIEFAGKRRTPEALRFAPHETKHVPITEALVSLKLTAFQAPTGGFTIAARGNQPALVAQGKVTDADSGQITALDFPLPQVQAASALHATGVPIGRPTPDSPFAGARDANFIPHLYLRNLLSSEQTLNLTIEYPGESEPKATTLPPIILSGYTTQEIRLDDYFTYLPLPLPYCSIRIQYNGPRGSVMGELTAVNETSGKASQIGLANEGNGYVGSLSSYWSFDERADFIVFLTNMSEKECRVGFRIEAGGVTYFLTHLKLIPHETKSINLRELIDKHEPDIHGTLIPPNTTEGRLSYIRLDNVPMMGRVTVVPRIPKPAETQ